MKNKPLLLRILMLCAVFTALFAICVSAAAIPGDVDADGKLSAADARLALRASVGLEKYTAGTAAFEAADVDHDKKISAADARLILRAAVGLEKLAPAAHEHSYGAWIKETKSTGTATGNHYRVCSCGDKQTAACTFGAKVYTSDNKTPTCTKGTSYYTQCTVCGNKKGSGEAALGHNYVTSKRVEPGCTTAGSKTSKCKRCDATKTETLAATGHKCKDANFKIDADIKCIVCGETVMPSFNKLVNVLKTTSHKYTSFEHNVTNGTVKTNALKLNPIFESFLGDDFNTMLAESFTEPSESYTELVENRNITDNSFMLVGKNVVSALQDKDVKSLTVTPMNKVDFVAAFPESLSIQKSGSYTNKTFDFTTVKAKAAHKVNKVEVVIPQEKYSSFKDNNTETALMRIDGTDIRLLAQSASDFTGDMEDLGADAKIDMKLNEVTTDLTVTYYFDAVSNEPLAAVYTLATNMDEHVDISFGMNMSEFGMGDGTVNILSGYLDMLLHSVSDYYYFFDGYFK